jgi:hypothetical protein
MPTWSAVSVYGLRLGLTKLDQLEPDTSSFITNATGTGEWHLWEERGK